MLDQSNFCLSRNSVVKQMLSFANNEIDKISIINVPDKKDLIIFSLETRLRDLEEDYENTLSQFEKNKQFIHQLKTKLGTLETMLSTIREVKI